MSKNLYRVGKKSDLDEIIKNNFFKPICIIFTTKEIEKEFEDKIANLFKEVSKNNTYCMYLLINLDNFIDNINFFNQMKINSPNFIAYFKGKQISGSSFICEKDSIDNYINTIKNLIDKINSSYVQRLINLFNQNDQELNEKQSNKEKVEDEKVEDEKENEEDKKNYNKDKKVENKKNNKEEEEEDEDEDSDEDEDEDEDDNEDEDDDKYDEKKSEDKEDINNIKKRSIEIDVEQIEIDKKKEKLKELIKLKKNLKK
jgi:hypothetical protein